METRLSEKAKADIETIYRHGFSQWGEQQADRYYIGLMDAFEFIETFPMAAPLRESIYSGLRLRVYQSHIILYELDAQGPYILRVLHGHYDWQNDEL